MKLLLMVMLSCITLNGSVPADMDTVRNNYMLAANDKELCREMIGTLKQKNDPVHIAYLGAFQAIWAKHTLNPLKKWGTFKEGRGNIEKAVSLAPADAEIRFIRLSVQMNAPGFLGYKDNIKEDRNFILANIGTIRSDVLKMMINDLMSKQE